MTRYQTPFRNFFKRSALGLLALAWAATACVTAQAADLVVTRYFSGLWDQFNQENQGVVLQIIDHEVETKRAVAYWFTYGDDLESAWFIGIGEVVGAEVVLELYTVTGVGFMEDAQPDIDNVSPVGSMVMSFRNCNHGTVAYELGGGETESGEFEVRKLAGLYNSRCSGGISDDTPGHARPEQLEVALEPAREDITGQGKAKFWQRPDRSDFIVSAEDLPDAVYELVVCGNPVGGVEILGGSGETHFRSPQTEGTENLFFDPRPCEIALHDGAGAALTSGEDRLAEKSPGNGGGHGGGGGNGMTDIEAGLESTGAVEGARGTATYRDKQNSTEFEVDVRDVPAGSYRLFVGGALAGEFEVAVEGDDLKGKIRFSDPQKEDRLLLDFDPLGAWIEVLDGDTVVLEVLFPES